MTFHKTSLLSAKRAWHEKFSNDSCESQKQNTASVIPRDVKIVSGKPVSKTKLVFWHWYSNGNREAPKFLMRVSPSHDCKTRWCFCFRSQTHNETLFELSTQFRLADKLFPRFNVSLNMLSYTMFAKRFRRNLLECLQGWSSCSIRNLIGCVMSSPRG